MLRDREYFLDIIEAAKRALSYLEGKTKEVFLNDYQCQDATIRCLEIIGEAAKRISDETHDIYSDLPWADMIGMRNVMIHQYDSIDLFVVWETVKTDLPVIVNALSKLLDD